LIYIALIDYFIRELYKKAVIQMKNTVRDLRAKVDKLKDLKNYPFEKKYKELVKDVSSKIQVHSNLLY
jgi:hypothetical protein